MHVLDRRADGLRAVAQRDDLDRRRDGGLQARQLGLDPVDSVDDVGAGLLVNRQHDRGLAVGPGGLGRVLRPGHRLTDVTHAHRPPATIADDDVVPVLGLRQLVVGVDRERPLGAHDGALGIVDGRDRERRAHVLEGQALGDELRRIELDTDGGLLLAADRDLRHAGDLADLRRELGLDIVVDLGQRQRVRGGAQLQDRRICRVHFPVGRRRRQVLGQLAARGVDRALHVVRRAIDVAVEIELDGDGGRAEHARRGHLRDPGNLRELGLERLRHRCGHGFGARAGQACAHLDGREVDLRERRDRQPRIGHHAREQDGDHQQRGCDRIPNERR